MTEDQLFDILRPIILTVTGVPECILTDPNRPGPEGVYAAVKPQVSIVNRGQANVSRKAGTAQATQDVTVKAQLECRAWVNFYRGDARTNAQKLIDCNKRPDISADLFKAKLGWAGTSQVNDLTALQSDKWESRAQIELTLLYETSDPIVINSIERIDYGVQYEDGTTVISGEVVTPDAP